MARRGEAGRGEARLAAKYSNIYLDKEHKNLFKWVLGSIGVGIGIGIHYF